jgi:hypothetical protein
MTTDEEIKRLLDQADALKATAKAEAALEKATEAYRADPTDAKKAAYRKANVDLAAARSTARADRPMGVGGDAFLSEEN